MSDTLPATVPEPPVLRERHGATLLITLNRPAQRNAIDLELRAALADAVFEARDDDTVKAVVIAGSGGAFSAGGDLKSLTAEARSVYQDRDRIRRIHTWLRELVHLEKPVIAAVDGPAFGAGFSIALACDFVLATPRSTFCAVFGRIGLVPDMAMFFLLPRIVGLQRAKELIFSARDIGAEEARTLGIVLDLTAPEHLMEKALAIAHRLCDASTEAIGMAKNVLNRAHNLDYDSLAELEAHAQAVARHSEYHRAAVQAFLDKRPLKLRWQR
jgi:2-(1,2-epoxy-1,2-dihydrophenyl)acetyl-CoA isomerase